MPLPQTFRDARLIVNGQSFDLVNVSVTSQETSYEREPVMGFSGRVRGFTSGRTTERATIECELIPVPIGRMVADMTATIGGRTFPIVEMDYTYKPEAIPTAAQLEALQGSLKPSAPPKSRWDRLMADENLC
jgi:hypothetical protein